MYKQMEAEEWKSLNFKSDFDGKVRSWFKGGVVPTGEMFECSHASI